MARIKPNIGRIEDLQAANLALKEIGIMEGEIDKIDVEANQSIGEIKAGAAKRGAPARRRIMELSAMLAAFAEYNRQELFKDRKSVEMSFGSFGYRKSTSIRTKKTTVELLKKMRLGRYVRVKEEPDKEAMAALDDETLAQVDAVRKSKDEFFCETDREAVNKELLREQIA